jgi:predicted acyltransferase
MVGISQTPARLGSLDMLRGIAIAGMVLVNNPGSWQHMFPLLRHAGWTGYTLADLVFPFFLFAMGSSQSFSLADTAHTGRLPLNLFIRILRRTLILFLIGLFLNALSGLLNEILSAEAHTINNLRIMGILQRIALVYCAAAICIVFLSERLLWLTIALLLLGYWAVLAGFPGSLTPGNNPALFIDRLLLGASHLYEGGLDPEGLFSSVSSLATALLGYKAGFFLRQTKGSRAASYKLFAAGMLAIALGSLWGLWLPVCKDLWTGSYALVSAGWTAAVFALCNEALKLQSFRRLGMPLEIMGRNALFLFVASCIVMRILLAVRLSIDGQALNLWFWLYDRVFASWMGRNDISSFSLAACYLAAWWLVLYIMDRLGWRIKA